VALESGAQGLRRYLTALHAGPELAVTRAALGVTAAEFDEAFRAYVNARLLER
jgi:hypothetical protein